MKKIFPIIGLTYVVIINSGCPKPCIEANLSFNVHSQIVPDKDSIQIGDTLYLESTFPTNIIDQRSGQLMDYSNSKGIGSTLTVIKLAPSDTTGKDAVFDFSYISIQGKIYNDRTIPRPDGVQQLTYGEINGKYVLKIGLVPYKKGNYVLVIGNGLSNGRRKEKSCEKASFNISFEATDQHYYLIENWVPGIKLDDYGKVRVYYFIVY